MSAFFAPAALLAAVEIAMLRDVRFRPKADIPKEIGGEMEARVSDLKWISDSASEAEITLTTSEGSLVAFCQPCGLQEGDLVHEPVHAFGLRSARLHPEGDQSITRKSGLGHEVVGTIVDLNSQLMNSLGFSIRIDDDLPGGLTVGDQVLISCGRLDIW